MNRFLVAFCGFGVGVLAGLVIALVTQPTLRQAQADCAAAIERATSLKAAAADCEERLGEALTAAREAREKEQGSEHECAGLRAAIENLADNEFRSQAFFGLVCLHPEATLILQDAAFSEFRETWWAPEDSWRFFWGSDLEVRSGKQVFEHGVTARAVFRTVTAAMPEADYRDRLKVARIGLKAIPRIEKERARKLKAGKDRAT